MQALPSKVNPINLMPGALCQQHTAGGTACVRGSERADRVRSQRRRPCTACLSQRRSGSKADSLGACYISSSDTSHQSMGASDAAIYVARQGNGEGEWYRHRCSGQRARSHSPTLSPTGARKLEMGRCLVRWRGLELGWRAVVWMLWMLLAGAAAQDPTAGPTSGE